MCFCYHNICQNLHISVLILCFIFNIHLPIYKHVFSNPKQLTRILYLSIILESLKNTLVLTSFESSILKKFNILPIYAQVIPHEENLADFGNSSCISFPYSVVPLEYFL